MTLKHIAVYFSGMVALGMGSMLLFAQSPQPPHATLVRVERVKLRAEVIKLRTEVEMVRFDYEFQRDMLRDQMKANFGLRILPEMLAALEGAESGIRVSINGTQAKPNRNEPQPQSELEKKQAAEEAKAEAEADKKEAAFLAEQKKQLARQFSQLTAKQLELEDAERNYREASR